MPGAAEIRWIRQTLREAAWAPLVVLGVIVAADRIFDVFARFPWFDVPAHFLGGIAATYLFRRAAANARSPAGSSSGIGPGYLAFGCTAGTAMLWEVFEFSSDRLLLTSLQHGTGDTLSDLVFGLAGSAAYLVLRRAFGAFASAQGSAAQRDRADQ